MLEASRPKDMSRPVVAAAAARQITPERAKAVAAAAVIEAVSSIASGSAGPGQSGEPNGLGRMFADTQSWARDDDGVPFRRKGPKTFDAYIQRVFWDQTESGHATGYVDLGWLQPARIPTEANQIDVDGRHHKFADHNLKNKKCLPIVIHVALATETYIDTSN